MTGAIEVPAYFAIGEPTPAGAALRPVFVGRADPVQDARWQRTLYSLGMQPAAPGTHGKRELHLVELERAVGEECLHARAQPIASSTAARSLGRPMPLSLDVARISGWAAARLRASSTVRAVTSANSLALILSVLVRTRR